MFIEKIATTVLRASAFLVTCIIMLCIFAIARLAHADDAAPAVVADPTWGDAILKFIENPTVIISVVAMIIEAAMRIFPTAVPVSLLIPVKYAVKVIGAVLDLLGKILEAVIASANNVK